MSAIEFVADASIVIGHATGRGLGEQLYLAANRVLAALLLLVLGPLMLFVALLIWSRDGAPVLYSHYRVGRNGRLFKCMKFRTMVRDADHLLAELLARDPARRAEWEREQKLSNDSRVTPVGRFLRRTSLDELPQLVNVLRGEMSLVGPRPITVPELERYQMARWHYLSVTPGITGLWQVSGRNALSYQERVALDRRYVEHRSLGLDSWILLKTVWVVFRGHGAQ